jgi:hypothetical protein
MKRNFVLIVCLVGLSLSIRTAELKQKTATAFDKYVAATEARINSELRPGGIFLYVDALQSDAMKSSYDKLRNGEALVEKRETEGPGYAHIAITPDTVRPAHCAAIVEAVREQRGL